MKKFFILLFLSTSSAFAIDVVENFQLKEEYLIKSLGTDITSYSSGFKFNEALGESDRVTTYFIQNGEFKNNNKINQNEPFCQISLAGEMPKGKVVMPHGVLTRRSLTFGIDAKTNPDKPEVMKTESTSFEILTLANLFPKEQMVPGMRLNIDSSDYAPVKWLEEGGAQATTPSFQCNNLDACSSLKDLRIILGNKITLLPDDKHSATLPVRNVERANAGPQKCHEEIALTRSIEKAQFEVFSTESKEMIRKIVNAVNNDEITPEKAFQQFSEEFNRIGSKATAQ